MSHKAAKAIRKIIRAGGTDPRQVKLASGPRFIAGALPGIHPGCTFIPRDLVPNCGRALYRNTKRLHRSGAFA